MVGDAWAFAQSRPHGYAGAAAGEPSTQPG
jgi:hypothetical protein